MTKQTLEREGMSNNRVESIAGVYVDKTAFGQEEQDCLFATFENGLVLENQMVSRIKFNVFGYSKIQITCPRLIELHITVNPTDARIPAIILDIPAVSEVIIDGVCSVVAEAIPVQPKMGRTDTEIFPEESVMFSEVTADSGSRVIYGGQGLRDDPYSEVASLPEFRVGHITTQYSKIAGYIVKSDTQFVCDRLKFRDCVFEVNSINGVFWDLLIQHSIPKVKGAGNDIFHEQCVFQGSLSLDRHISVSNEWIEKNCRNLKSLRLEMFDNEVFPDLSDSKIEKIIIQVLENTKIREHLLPPNLKVFESIDKVNLDEISASFVSDYSGEF